MTLSSLPTKKLLFTSFQRNMYACRHILSRFESVPQNLGSLIRDQVQRQSPMIRASINCNYYGVDRCRSIYRLLHSQSACHVQWLEQSSNNFQLSHTFPFSVGAATNISFDSAPQDDQLDEPVLDSNRKLPAERPLKLFSGSCYLPHPDKEETGGEDAHFICDNECAIGVADGVGGWTEVGVNSGHYARELMCNSASAIQDEPDGLIDPTRVLKKAYLNTKAKGSSTACIVAVTDQGIRAVNLGDSGFIVVRDGSTIFRSPTQQHDFNFPFQLESDNGSDLPSSGQGFTFPVESGDVVVMGTDGLFDNLYNNEINAIIVHGTRTRSGPQIIAQKIAALARQRAQDKNRQTPFSTSAQDAGYRYYGGKLDDITVVVSFVTSSSG